MNSFYETRFLSSLLQLCKERSHQKPKKPQQYTHLKAIVSISERQASPSSSLTISKKSPSSLWRVKLPRHPIGEMWEMKDNHASKLCMVRTSRRSCNLQSLTTSILSLLFRDILRRKALCVKPSVKLSDNREKRGGVLLLSPSRYLLVWQRTAAV